MGRNHGRLGNAKRIVKRLVRNVRDIHDHSELVELANDVLAERREAIVSRLVGRRVSPVDVEKMCESQIAYPKSRISAEDTQVVINHVTTFHAHKGSDFALARYTADLRSGCSKHEILRMGSCSAADRVDQVKDTLNGRRAC